MADRTITGLYDLIDNISSNSQFPTGKDTNPGYAANAPTGLDYNIDDQLFIVSHPMSRAVGTQSPTDYATMKVRFADLAQLLSIALYPTISAEVSNDLSLGDLAHQNGLLRGDQIRNGIVSLEAHISDFGPFAVISNKLPDLTPTTTSAQLLNNKLGFKMLAFKDDLSASELCGSIQTWQISNAADLISTTSAEMSNVLSLGDLAHKNESALSLSNLAHQNTVRFDQIPGVKDLISTTFNQVSTRLSLGDLAHKNESALSLSNLAHQNVIVSSQISGKVPFDQKISNYRSTLDPIYLSVATANTFGSIKVGYAENPLPENRAYKVQLTNGVNSGNAFVEVPWHYTNSDSSATMTAGFVDSGYKLNFNSYRKVYKDGDSPTNVVSTDNKQYPAIIPYVSRINAGLMHPEDYRYLYDELYPNITSNIPLATDTIVGGMKLAYTNYYFEDALHTPVYLNAENKAYISVHYANDTNHGLMTSADYNYLHALKTAMPVTPSGGSSSGSFTLPVATSATLGAVKIGFAKTRNYAPVELNHENKMYVNVPDLSTATPTILGGIKVGAAARSDGTMPVKIDENSNAYVSLPTATSTTLGGIRLGFQQRGKMYPVQTEGGKAYVEVNWSTTGATDILGDLIDSLYPVGAIYITTAATCPLASIRGTWEKIEGRYLLASGQLGNASENYAAGSYVDAALPTIPSHTHTFSFGFSSSNSKSGYPSHGGASQCNHSSYSFTTGGCGALNNGIYGKATTVRPKAYVVNVFRRKA